MVYSLAELFEQFVKERIYLKNVTNKTIYFYRAGFRALEPFLTDELSETQLKNFLIHLRERGVKPVSINTYARALNAFFNWAHESGHLPKYHLPKLKEDQPALKVVSQAHLRAVINFKPKTFAEKRLWVLLQLLIDTGMRIEESLTLTKEAVDFDNLLVKVKGKGGKERIIPFSFEMRKVLYPYMRNCTGYVFPTKQGRKLQYNIVKEDYYDLCKKLGLKDRGFHRFRHTFAIQHLRNGGTVFGLQKILGHTELSVTRKYVDMQTEDLVREHATSSLLARLK